MRWNNSILLLAGFALGVVVCAVGIAAAQSSFGAPFDLEAAGKVATILVAPLTLGLVGLSWVLARETRQTWIQNRTPSIVVTIESTRVSINHMELVIENVGGGAAYNIAVTFNPDLDLLGEGKGEATRKISSIPLLSFPILKPHQRMTTLLTRWNLISPPRTLATATYKDVDDVTHTSSNGIDLSCLEGTGGLGTDPLEKIADETSKIRSAVENLASGFKRLKVDVHTSEDRVQEQANQDKRIEEIRRKQTDEAANSGT